MRPRRGHHRHQRLGRQVRQAVRAQKRGQHRLGPLPLPLLPILRIPPLLFLFLVVALVGVASRRVAPLHHEHQRVHEQPAPRRARARAPAAVAEQLVHHEAADAARAAHRELLHRREARLPRLAERPPLPLSLLLPRRLRLRLRLLLSEARGRRLDRLRSARRRRRAGPRMPRRDTGAVVGLIGGVGASPALVTLHAVDGGRCHAVPQRRPHHRRLLVGGEAAAALVREWSGRDAPPLDHARRARQELVPLVRDRGGAPGAASRPQLVEARRKVGELPDVARRAVGLEDARRVDRVLEAVRHRRPLVEVEPLAHDAARAEQPPAARDRVNGVGRADGVVLGLLAAPLVPGARRRADQQLVRRRHRPLRRERVRVLGLVVGDAGHPPAPVDEKVKRVHGHLGVGRLAAVRVDLSHVVHVQPERARPRRLRRHVPVARQHREPHAHIVGDPPPRRQVDRRMDGEGVLGRLRGVEGRLGR